MNSIEIAVDYFHEEFKRSDVAKAYAKSRGLSKDIIQQFKIGYAPPEPKYTWRFRNRLIFPIWDQQSKLVGWTGRTLVNDPAKYVNVKESAIFKKNRLLYGYNFAVQDIYNTQTAILCEGQMDTVAMHQFGITNSVASSGTSSFSIASACLLARYASKVFIVFDGDNAGRNASLAAIKFLEEVGITDIYNVVLPDKEDPASILMKYGKEHYLRLLEDARCNRRT